MLEICPENWRFSDGSSQDTSPELYLPIFCQIRLLTFCKGEVVQLCTGCQRQRCEGPTNCSSGGCLGDRSLSRHGLGGVAFSWLAIMNEMVYLSSNKTFTQWSYLVSL